MLAMLAIVAGAATLTQCSGSPGPPGARSSSANLMTDSLHSNRKPNHLAGEKSPYLLQHAYNPVDWNPWGDEAFEKARRENRPIFLSIGYSTCHWCHVMERESFENDSVANLLNTYFVPVKVDREERPDVDRIYMNATQAMGMGGGWPLNVFLTPNLEPFFGGTYFPPTARGGRPGMMELLPRVHEVWTERGADLAVQGQRVLDAIEGLNAAEGEVPERATLFESAYGYLERANDAEQGGFGNAPKFPSTSNLNFLMRYWAADPAARGKARDMVLGQLDAMRKGGIHDHLGGGFHRYATDRNWLTPHFEKMLYDQAQIAWSFLEAYQVTGDEAYAGAARGIFTYVSRDLTAKEGAFLSAEDADSEGEEGKFYVWTPGQIEQVLGKDPAALFSHHYGVTGQGNFEHGTSILNEVHSLEETARAFKLKPEEASKRLAASRAKLLEARGKRIRPHLDDKVLVAWNGLMISAYARGARVLHDPALAQRAERAATFIWDRLYDERTGDMKRRWRDGEAAEAGQLDDYAYFALACIDLYEATFDPRWLTRAVAVTESQIKRFWDEAGGGFFESPAGDPHIRIRIKDGFDGAEIAGNSIAAWNLQMLGRLLDREEWLTKARQTFDYFATRLGDGAASMPQMLVAMDLEHAVPRHIVVAGAVDGADTRVMIEAFNRRFLPHDALLVVDGGARQKDLARLAGFVEPLVMSKGKATAYVCVNYACKLPTTDPAVFAAQLAEVPAAARGTGANR
jgi:uncharacterized protein YyaL (SSP411 family)